MNLFWTDEAHTPMGDTRSRDVTRKRRHSWLANVTLDWRHVMETAVECNNQNMSVCIRKFDFIRRFFFKIYIKTSQIMNKYDAKI